METNYILGFICLLLAWVAAYLFGVKTAMVENKKISSQIFLFGTLTFTLISGYLILFSWDDYRDGQIDALKGKYQYRMEINYDQHGTPKDTIYVKDSYILKPTATEYKVVPAVTYRDTVVYINN